jgi:hypothetical protein
MREAISKLAILPTCGINRINGKSASSLPLLSNKPGHAFDMSEPNAPSGLLAPNSALAALPWL